MSATWLELIAEHRERIAHQDEVADGLLSDPDRAGVEDHYARIGSRPDLTYIDVSTGRTVNVWLKTKDGT